jgi:hypothetical protein
MDLGVNVVNTADSLGDRTFRRSGSHGCLHGGRTSSAAADDTVRNDAAQRDSTWLSSLFCGGCRTPPSPSASPSIPRVRMLWISWELGAKTILVNLYSTAAVASFRG